MIGNDGLDSRGDHFTDGDKSVAQALRGQVPDAWRLQEKVQRPGILWEADTTPLERQPQIIYLKPGGAEAQSELPRDDGLANAGRAAKQQYLPVNMRGGYGRSSS
jgi:hypothetical protein